MRKTFGTAAVMAMMLSGATVMATAQAPGPNDATFVKKAIMGNNAEIDTAKLALQKSNNQQVKDFAQKMVDDHTKMLNDLHTVAQSSNISYEDKPSPKEKMMYDKLSKLNGAAFDKAFVNGMVKDHEEDVALFSKEVQSGSNDAAKTAANDSLPVIKEHLQIVQGLQSQGV